MDENGFHREIRRELRYAVYKEIDSNETVGIFVKSSTSWALVTFFGIPRPSRSLKCLRHFKSMIKALSRFGHILPLDIDRIDILRPENPRLPLRWDVNTSQPRAPWPQFEFVSPLGAQTACGAQEFGESASANFCHKNLY